MKNPNLNHKLVNYQKHKPNPNGYQEVLKP
jgi:hypothetical protein